MRAVVICFDAAARIRSIDMKCIEVGTNLLYGAEFLFCIVNLKERDVILIIRIERKRYL